MQGTQEPTTVEGTTIHHAKIKCKQLDVIKTDSGLTTVFSTSLCKAGPQMPRSGMSSDLLSIGGVGIIQEFFCGYIRSKLHMLITWKVSVGSM